MAVSTTNAFDGPFIANGVTTSFSFTFTAQTASDVRVLVDGADVSGYSVEIHAGGGGAISFDTAPATGSLLIWLDPDFAQETSFEDGSAWLAGPVNAVNDRAALRDQALARDIGRGFMVPPGESGIVLPKASERAGKYWGFDAQGAAVLLQGTTNAPASATQVVTSEGENLDAVVLETRDVASTANGLRPALASSVSGEGSDLVNFSGKDITPRSVSASGNSAFGSGQANVQSFYGRITYGAQFGPLTFGDLQYCNIQNFGRYGIDGNYAAIQHTDDTSCALFGFFKARGSQAARLPIQDGDDVGELSFHGWDGSTFVKGGILTPVVDGAVSAGIVPVALRLWTMNAAGALNLALAIRSDQSSEFKGSVRVQGGTLGYDPPDGATVVQSTSKTTAVSLNEPCGQITMSNSALGAGTEIVFQFNNTLIDNEDTILIHVAAGTSSWYDYEVRVGNFSAGSCSVAVKNRSASTLSEPIVLNFAVIKGST